MAQPKTWIASGNMVEENRKERWRSEYVPERIFIDARVLDLPLTGRILSRLKSVPSAVLRSGREKRRALDEILAAADPVGEGKKTLWLTANRGRFVKPCPCTPLYPGCSYFVIHHTLQCPLNCAYCILQGYLAEPWIAVHVNTEDLWGELDRFLAARRGRYLRMGTGELGDSLALDPITGFSTEAVSYFRDWPNVDFEFKTKTLNIGSVLRLDAPRNIVISWSLNTERMAREGEIGAPSVSARLDAARAAVEKGFRVGFHFDPLIRHFGWRKGYEDVVAALFHKIPTSSIAWISLGEFRFPPGLKKIIQARFPESRITADEFVPCEDGKRRYFRPLRFELFGRMIELIRKCGGRGVPVYLCMESAETWEKMLGGKPEGGKGALESALSPRRESSSEKG